MPGGPFSQMHSEQNRDSKSPLRVISMAWGESFVDEFLDYCLPALLAPGNLPALTDDFNPELVFVTETRLFAKVEASTPWQEARSICDTKLISLDDLIASKDAYGMSITYSLFRGFEDLGSGMTTQYLLFLNSDFILADGSYRGLLPYLRRGDPLVLAPSYCVNAEDVIPELECYRSDCGSIAIDRRLMARMILENRHLTVRTKTINQKAYHLGITDQFYWAVDEWTLLGHQLPIALVAMKPEAFLNAPTSLWDYGVIADFCPSMKFSVIGDSDEFLMLELREAARCSRDAHFGWPNPKEIALGLRNVATKYTIEVGKSPLTLHAEDLPPEVDAGRRRLGEFFGSVLDELGLPPSHINHPQWTCHFDRFHERRTQALARMGAKPDQPFRPMQEGAKKGQPRTGEMPGPRQTHADLLPVRAAQVLSEMFAVYLPADRAIRAARHMSCVMAEFLLLRESIERMSCKAERDGGSCGTHLGSPCVSAVADMEASLAGSARRHAGFSTFLRRSVKEAFDQCARELGMAPVYVETEPADAKPDVTTAVARPSKPPGIAQRTWRALFGAAPHYRPWHYLFLPMKALVATPAWQQLGSARVLFVSGTGRLDRVVSQMPLCTTIRLDNVKGYDTFRHLGREPFDACVIEADMDELHDFRRIHQAVKPLLKPSGQLAAAFIDVDGSGNPLPRNSFPADVLPLSDAFEFVPVGGIFAIVASRVRYQSDRRLRRAMNWAPTALHIAGSWLLAAPFALLAFIVDQVARKVLGRAPFGRCSSILVTMSLR